MQIFVRLVTLNYRITISLSLNFANARFGFSSEPRNEQIPRGHLMTVRWSFFIKGCDSANSHLFALVPVQPLHSAADTTCSSLAAVPLGDAKRGFTAARRSSWAGSAEPDRTEAGTSRAPSAPRWRQGSAEAETPAPPGIAPHRPARHDTAAAPADRVGQALHGRLTWAASAPPPHRSCAPPSRRTGKGREAGPGRCSR